MDGGVDQGPWLQERVGGGVGAMTVPKKGEGWGLVGCSKEEQVQGRGQGRVGLAVGGGVGGRGTGLRDGANFATCVVFLLFLTRTKRRKMAFFEGCPVRWGGVPTGAGLVDGEGLAWRVKAGIHHWSWLGGGGVREAEQGLGGGARASVPGG